MVNIQLEAFGEIFESESAKSRFLNRNYKCPFDERIEMCEKPNRGELRYGNCSARVGDYKRIICPRRFYERNYKVLNDVKNFIWGEERRARAYDELRLQIRTSSGDSFNYGTIDWILVLEDEDFDFIGVEVQADSTTSTGKFKTGIEDLLSGQLKTNYGFGLNTLASFKGFIPQFIFKGQLFDDWKKPYVAIMQDELWEIFVSKFRIRYRKIRDYTTQTFLFFIYKLEYNSERGKYELILDNVYSSRWIDILFAFAVEEELLLDYSQIKEIIKRKMERYSPILRL
ncbi:hypothetical protein DRP07_09805 [Archaeoglobales archaeon]|nr:MAG: hypothetical protein DRP07_09805 [Archaeoglobales archaeon]